MLVREMCMGGLFHSHDCHKIVVKLQKPVLFQIITKYAKCGIHILGEKVLGR